ncbi:MAG: Arm DNA-binding domain-containing protein, partial [Gemmatimonadetes bacterium]|nr:Arm DNA-binding domain-containing protein [Gemmatimonadota bacterium]
MPRHVKKPLDDRSIRAFITKAKAGTLMHAETGAALTAPKLFDGRGLFLTVTAAGTPVWRIKYRYDGKDKTLSPGLYPEVTLQTAREKRDWARAEVKAGRNPIQVQRVEKAANVAATAITFADVCAQWLALREKAWSPSLQTLSPPRRSHMTTPLQRYRSTALALSVLAILAACGKDSTSPPRPASVAASSTTAISGTVG